MEMKHKVLHFLLVSAFWVAAALVLTAQWHKVPNVSDCIPLGGEPEFVRDVVDGVRNDIIVSFSGNSR
ncbi:MAG TPA: hypothetical protein VFX30_01400 [bacterium]|nr:hypothetical protein [bacterium]